MCFQSTSSWIIDSGRHRWPVNFQTTSNRIVDSRYPGHYVNPQRNPFSVFPPKTLPPSDDHGTSPFLAVEDTEDVEGSAITRDYRYIEVHLESVIYSPQPLSNPYNVKCARSHRVCCDGYRFGRTPNRDKRRPYSSLGSGESTSWSSSRGTTQGPRMSFEHN